MSTSLHSVFIVAFGNVSTVEAIFNIRGGKMLFSARSQNSTSEKSIFDQFEVIFLNA